MEAVDFRIEIGDRGEGGYLLKTRDRDGSIMQSWLALDPVDPLLRDQLSALESVVVASGARTRRISSPDEQRIQRVGGLLFQRLLADELSGLLRAARNDAARDGKHVRLVLQVEPAELAGLPWEFLYDARNDEYLAQSCLLVRNPAVPTPEKPLRTAAPLRVLAMSAAPGNLAVLNVDEEKSRLESALAEAVSTGRVELHWVPGETKRHLLDTLRRGPWHIFHFIGHGDFDVSTGQGMLALTGDNGRSDPLPAGQLATALGNHHPCRLVVLNACRTARSSHDDAFSGVAAALIRRSVPAVVAMQYAISDPAALEFSRAFYGAVADSEPIDFAVRHGREAVAWAQNGTMEWGTPVLYLRSPDGHIFDFDNAGPTMSVPTATAPTEASQPEAATRRAKDDFDAAVTRTASPQAAKAIRELVDHAKRKSSEDIYRRKGAAVGATLSFQTEHGFIHPWSAWINTDTLQFSVNFDRIHRQGTEVPATVMRRFCLRIAALPGAASEIRKAESNDWRTHAVFAANEFFADPNAIDTFLAALDELLDGDAIRVGRVVAWGRNSPEEYTVPATLLAYSSGC